MTRYLTTLGLLTLLLPGVALAQQPEDPALQLDPPAGQPPPGRDLQLDEPGLAPTGGDETDSWLDEDYEAEAAGEQEFDEAQAAEDEAWLRGELDSYREEHPEEFEDAEADGEHADGEHAEHADGEHADGEHADGEHADGEHADGEHAPGAEHGEHHAENLGAGPIQSFFANIVNFLIWLAIVIYLGRKPLSEFLESRRHAIKDGLDEAARLTKAAEEKYAECNDRIEHLDDELERLKEEMIATGKAEADRIMGEAEAKAARLRRDTQFVIEQRVKQLRADLTREAVEAAIAAAEVALTQHVSEADQETLADGFLSQIQSKIDDEVQA